MKKILFIIIIILISVNAFSKTNTIYFDNNNREQIYSFLKDNNLADCIKYLSDGIVPFGITEQGNQVIIKKGTYIEGVDIKSTYTRGNVDFNDKKYAKYLSDKKTVFESDGYVVSTYTLSNDIKKYLDNIYNVANTYGVDLQLNTLEKDNKILWYTISGIGKPIQYPFMPPEPPGQKKTPVEPFKVMDFKLDNGNKALFCYMKNSELGSPRYYYIDVIEFGEKTTVLRNVIPFYPSGIYMYNCNATFVSNSIIKTDLTLIDLEKDKYEFLWIFDYPFNKDKLTMTTTQSNIKFIDITPKVLWMSDRDKNYKYLRGMVYNRFYYDEIISDTRPTIKQLMNKFPKDRFFDLM